MQAIFRDKYGVFSVDHVEIIQYDKERNVWIVFFDSFENGGKEEYAETELEMIVKD